MWTRFINIMKYVWKNPIVQFACFTILEWVIVVFHKSTKNKFKKKSIEAITDACSQDYSVGTNEDTPEIKPEEKSETVTEVVVEKPKRTRKAAKKKVIEKVEETKPAKPKRVIRKKKTTETPDTKSVTKKPRTRKKKTEVTETIEEKK